MLIIPKVYNNLSLECAELLACCLPEPAGILSGALSCMWVGKELVDRGKAFSFLIDYMFLKFLLTMPLFNPGRKCLYKINLEAGAIAYAVFIF